MPYRSLSLLVLLGVLTLVGCTRTRCCPATRADPLRDVGIDLRGLQEEGPVGTVVALPGRSRQVLVEMKVARLPEARAAAALGAYRPVSASEPSRLSDAGARAMVARWGADEQVRVVSAPTLLALPGQRATVFVGETIRFGRTEAKVNAEGGLEFSIHEYAPDEPATLGQEMAITAEIGPDGRRVTIQLDGRWRELVDELPAGSEASMTRAQFEQHVREHRLETTFETQSGSWVLIGSPEALSTDEGPRLQVTLLRAIVVPGTSGGD